jgi:CrcB protein
MIKELLFVGLGGGLGSIARYLCQRWLLLSNAPAFPWGTFSVNISGCFLIGLFWGMFFRSGDSTDNWKLFLMTGLCGGYTTFSAFTLESIGLIKEQKILLFFLYAAGSVIIGLLATWFGMRLVR